jgi:hypothetical protein
VAEALLFPTVRMAGHAARGTCRRPGSANGGVRLLLRAEGLVVLAASVAAYAQFGAGWGWFAALFLLPDVSFLAYLAGPRWGALAYNAAHSYLGAVGLLAAGVLGASPLLLAAGWSGARTSALTACWATASSTARVLATPTWAGWGRRTRGENAARAGLLGAAALVHGGLLLRPPCHGQARIAEAVIAAVLLAAWALSLACPGAPASWRCWARPSR